MVRSCPGGRPRAVRRPSGWGYRPSAGSVATLAGLTDLYAVGRAEAERPLDVHHFRFALPNHPTRKKPEAPDKPKRRRAIQNPDRKAVKEAQRAVDSWHSVPSSNTTCAPRRAGAVDPPVRE